MTRSYDGLIGPLLTVCGGVAVLFFLHAGETRLIVDAKGFGPLSWPRVMLWGVVATGVLWGISRYCRLIDAPGISKKNGRPDNLGLVSGVVVVVLYGVAMLYIGFAIATLLFLVVWFLVGGMRSFWQIMGNSILGTLFLLYLFLKIAYLPLPRGIGYMDKITVGLYQFLGIY